MPFPRQFPADKALLTVFQPKSSLWIIELHNGQDNRLTTTLVDHAIKPALDAVERSWREQWRAAQETDDALGGQGALIIVGRKDQDKFFSNGLDYESVQGDLNFFPVTFNPLLVRILAFPIPTIAAINGHCFAGGFMLSLACDYRVMTDASKRNAWICMNEFGAAWPLSFAALLCAKVRDQRVQRKIALEGHRFTPSEALAAGIIDYQVQGGTKDVLMKAETLGDQVGKNAATGVWGLIKSDLFRDTVETMQKNNLQIPNARIADAVAKSRI